RRIPGNVGAREVGEQVEGHHLVLKAGLRVDVRRVLVDVGEVTVDREATLVGARGLVAGAADHSPGSHTVACDRALLRTVLWPESAARLGRAREGVEDCVRPV